MTIHSLLYCYLNEIWYEDSEKNQIWGQKIKNQNCCTVLNNSCTRLRILISISTRRIVVDQNQVHCPAPYPLRAGISGPAFRRRMAPQWHRACNEAACVIITGSEELTLTTDRVNIPFMALVARSMTIFCWKKTKFVSSNIDHADVVDNEGRGMFLFLFSCRVCISNKQYCEKNCVDGIVLLALFVCRITRTFLQVFNFIYANVCV